jgi:esterase/lipase superfamily enzyme/ABC-type sugar transport system substrate-binding protein
MPRSVRLFAILFASIFSSCFARVTYANSVAIIRGGDSSFFDKRFAEGAQQAASDLGVQIIFYESTTDIELIKIIQLADRSGSVGIVISVNTKEYLDDLIKQANPKTIIVIASPAPTGKPIIPFVTWDEKHTGAVAADNFAAAFKKTKGNIEGEVLVVKPENSGRMINDRVEGFQAQLASHYPEINVTTREVSLKNTDKTIADAFTSTPDLSGVFAPDFVATPGVAGAIAQYSKSKSIKIVGATNDDWLLGDLKRPITPMATDFVIQDPYALGYQSVFRLLNPSEAPAEQNVASYVQAATVVPGINVANEFKDWSLVAGPGLSDDDQILHILYATNRTLLDEGRQNFSGEIDDERVHYGIAYVRVPEHHLFGHLEVTQQWDNSGAQTSIFMLKKRQGMMEDKFKSTIVSSTVKTAVIFVPGFRNNFDDGLFRFAQIIWDGQLRDMIPVLFSWPSRGDIKDYEYDGEAAMTSVDKFEKLLMFLQNECHIENINIIAHSMGNRIIVSALAELSKHQEISPIGEVVLAAADVNRNIFAQNASLIEAAAHGVTLYTSSSDRALDISEDIAQMPRIGKVESDGPIVINGADSIDVTSLGDDIFGLNHGTYSDSPVIEDIARLIRFRDRPPNIRTPRIRSIPEGSEHPRYWKYSP